MKNVCLRICEIHYVMVAGLMYNRLSFTISKAGMWKELALEEISLFIYLFLYVFLKKNLNRVINQIVEIAQV